MKRFIAGTACFYLLVCVLLIGFFSDDSESKMKNAEVNDIIFTIKILSRCRFCNKNLTGI